MSGISYTDVCFINVAADLFNSAVVYSRRRMGWARTRSAIYTRCRNGRVYRGGRCVGRRPRGRCGDWLFRPLLYPCTPPGWRRLGPGLRRWCECGHFLSTLALPPWEREREGVEAHCGFGPYWHDGITELLQIFQLHMHDMNLSSHHIPMVIYWIMPWWLWRAL